jgi:hypothetical protein
MGPRRRGTGDRAEAVTERLRAELATEAGADADESVISAWTEVGWERAAEARRVPFAGVWAVLQHAKCAAGRSCGYRRSRPSCTSGQTTTLVDCGDLSGQQSPEVCDGRDGNQHNHSIVTRCEIGVVRRMYPAAAVGAGGRCRGTRRQATTAPPRRRCRGCCRVPQAARPRWHLDMPTRPYTIRSSTV